MATSIADAARETAERMARAASDFLASLSVEQRERANLPFEREGRRVEWHYTPMMQTGLTLQEMEPGQQRVAHRLVATGLSVGGYNTAATIMGLENILDLKEGFRSRFWAGSESPRRGRDPLMYFVTVFGEPGGERWGWRFGGHHISLNHTIEGSALATPTPSFFGADPAEAPGMGQTLRPLAGEEDLGRELVQLLDDGQRALAILSPAAPLDIVQGNRPRVEDDAAPIPLWELMAPLPADRAAGMRRMSEQRAAEIGFGDAELELVRYSRAPKGLAAAKMTTGQRDALVALVRQYTGRLPDEVAAREDARLLPALGELHFAWAGGIERGQAHYYRVQGPRLLIEYDNVQNDANHIHAAWRDPEGDFGRDLLAEHYRAEHR